MVNLQKLILALPWLYSEAQSHKGGQVSFQDKHELDYSQSVSTGAAGRHTKKSIAIVGAGSCGLTSLRTFLDVADSADQDWDIVLFEKRAGVGGIWFPQEKKPEPPAIPETPMHKYLRMNTPHPIIAYPNFPFPPMTKLLPDYDAVWQYHIDFAAQHELTSHIRFNHTVTSAVWIGNSTDGVWNLTISRPPHALESGSPPQIVSEHKIFDHLVVAIGIDHFPHYVKFPGMEGWLSAPRSSGRERKVIHSTYYEGPEGYENATLLVVGGGPSGADMMLHTSPVTRKVYWSFKDTVSAIVNITLPYLPPWYDFRPPISHFTPDDIVFSDGTKCSDVDTIILATGYERRIPFLEESGLLHIMPSARSNSTPDPRLGLSSNLKYFFPVHQHILPVTPQLPTTAMGLIGLIGPTPRFYTTIAQTLYLAYAIIDPGILPSREEMLREVRQREERARALGYDPYLKGHHLPEPPGEADGKGVLDYMEELVQYLRDRHVAIPNSTGEGPFVEKSRRETFAESTDVHVNWLQIRERGEEEMNSWLRGVETEGEWAELMHRVAMWNGD